MITYEQFLSFINPDKIEEAKKFESSFFTMFRPGALTVCTVGFSIDMKDPENPDSEYWKEAEEIIKLFNPLHAWIGTKENQDSFKKDYPNITVEAYSYFENGGFLPIAVIPVAMIQQLFDKQFKFYPKQCPKYIWATKSLHCHFKVQS